MSKSIVLLLLAIDGSSVCAQDAPTQGLLYNTLETHSLTYRCDPVRNDQLNCEFVQTNVLFKATYSQLPGVLESARRQFRSEKPPTSQDCAMPKDLLDVLDGKKVTSQKEALAAMTPIEKIDVQRSARIYLDYCDKPTEENYVALARFSHEKDRRTCTVSSLMYKQSFQAITEGGGIVWVAQSTPKGACGVVELSRFEPEETRLGTNKFVNWKYIARKAITNPSAELFPGTDNTKCSSLDEKSYTYDWRSKEQQMSCDYIQFSLL